MEALGVGCEGFWRGWGVQKGLAVLLDGFGRSWEVSAAFGGEVEDFRRGQGGLQAFWSLQWFAERQRQGKESVSTEHRTCEGQK